MFLDLDAHVRDQSLSRSAEQNRQPERGDGLNRDGQTHYQYQRGQHGGVVRQYNVIDEELHRARQDEARQAVDDDQDESEAQ